MTRNYMSYFGLRDVAHPTVLKAFDAYGSEP